MPAMQRFEPYLDRWGLDPDGPALSTPRAMLLPVRQAGRSAMLKISQEPEEVAGARLMAWWSGGGAAPVLALDGPALLMARATGTRSLADMARGGRDDEATRILGAAAACLHRPRSGPRPALVPLAQWFQPLLAREHGQASLLGQCAATARELLEAPRDAVVLHGDIHHGNVLDFDEAGWLAIDPKGLHGERGFDYANILCNPDHASALAPGRLARRLDILAGASGIERRRLLQWVLAWCGLSAVWGIEDGDDPRVAMAVAQQAAAALG
ncbi:Aminoglycoside/hydroxyurea antibiotic resistance kinase [Delftia tsuruhatensis]|nr:Aminoglycoside/hydroxyurea antibiotic resistance kinase [Delftia tsuruhatensis]CAC9687492.1 Aminoglycoside/hydroxyurea antibiotic resistance kinase [Delftia tsuruhatensis]